MIPGRIGIVGSGSIGLYYGAKLAATGHDVAFLMRGGLEEARRDGIRVYSETTGDVHLAEPTVFASAEEIGPCSLVINSLKATSNDALAHAIPPLLGPDTALLTLQNGLGGDELLASQFGAERVLGGLCFICLTRRTPASVNHVGKGKLSIGEFGRPVSSRLRKIAEAFNTARVHTDVVENLAEERWRKLVWNIPFNGLSVAAGGVTVDTILADPVLHQRCRGLMEETIATANALGFPIEEKYADFQIDRTYPMGPYAPSTLIDWRAGQKLEVEPIWGEPLRRARTAGVTTPLLEALYAQLVALNTALP